MFEHAQAEPAMPGSGPTALPSTHEVSMPCLAMPCHDMTLPCCAKPNAALQHVSLTCCGVTVKELPAPPPFL